MTESRLITVGILPEPVRVDRFIAQELALFSRSQWEKRNGKAFIGGKEVKASQKLIGGEEVELVWEEPVESSLTAEAIPLDIVWENEQVVVVNKARGLVVHPAAGHASGTLVQGLLYHVKGLESAFEEEDTSALRPGIVHRLDKDTTGILICAKTPEALEALALQFRAKTTQKVYWAIVKGQPKSSAGDWKCGLARDPRNRQRFAAVAENQGKWAWTDWKVLAVSGKYSWLELRPHTGRTHQLRVQCAQAGLPILGDPIYTRVDSQLTSAPLMLHAHSLTLTLPSETTARTFLAPLPDDFLVTASAAGFSIQQPDGPN